MIICGQRLTTCQVMLVKQGLESGRSGQTYGVVFNLPSPLREREEGRGGGYVYE